MVLLKKKEAEENLASVLTSERLISCHHFDSRKHAAGQQWSCAGKVQSLP